MTVFLVVARTGALLRLIALIEFPLIDCPCKVMQSIVERPSLFFVAVDFGFDSPHSG